MSPSREEHKSLDEARVSVLAARRFIDTMSGPDLATDDFRVIVALAERLVQVYDYLLQCGILRSEPSKVRIEEIVTGRHTS